MSISEVPTAQTTLMTMSSGMANLASRQLSPREFPGLYQAYPELREVFQCLCQRGRLGAKVVVEDLLQKAPRRHQ